MTAETIAPPRPVPAGLRPALPALALGLIAFALLFHQEAAAAVRVWIQSTAYNHGFLILPIVAWLLWDRRAVLAGVSARPFPLAALGILPLAAVWLLADRLGIMEGRQLAAMTMLELLFLGVLGSRIYRLLLGPLLYLYFLVPFGSFLTPTLQRFTTWFVGAGLNLFGIPNYIDANLIQVPGALFYVAQACAGLRFLIAAIAFACLYALLMYRSPRRRAIFIGISLIVPVIANGLRALGIVTLGYALGSARAAATDHILYGWIFFSIVILLLVLIGLPFREDLHGWTAPDSADGPPRAPPRPLAAAFAVACLAALGPVASLGLHRAAAAALSNAPIAIPAQGCSATVSAPGPSFAHEMDGARIALARIACGGASVRVMIARFSPRADPGPILLAEREISGRVGAEDVTAGSLREGGLAWHMVQTIVPDRTTAFLLWHDGLPLRPDLRFRLRQGIASVIGGGSATVLVAVQPDPDPTGQTPDGRARALRAIDAYLRAQTEIAAALDRIAGATP